MKKLSIGTIALSALLLTGCISDIVSVPFAVAYNAVKYTVKGTAAVVGGTVDILTPDSDDKEKEKSTEKDDTSKSDNTK